MSGNWRAAGPMSRGDDVVIDAPGIGPPMPLCTATTRGPTARTRSRNGRPTRSSSRNQPPSIGSGHSGGCHIV